MKFGFTVSLSSQHFRDTVPPSEACLNSLINWSLAQAHQQSFLELFQSSISRRGARANLWLGSGLLCRNSLWQSGATSLAKKPDLVTRIESYQCGRKSTGMHLQVH